MKFLLTRAKGSTKVLAARLGVSRRTVERYRAGKLTTPQNRLQAALVEETESEWQPQVRAQAREQASISSGMMVEVTAYSGFEGRGSSDDGRIRHITTPISPTYVKRTSPSSSPADRHSPGRTVPMSSTKHLRAYAALHHVVDRLESADWSESISERGFRLSVDLEGAALSVSPRSTVPGPSAPPVRCRYSEEQRFERVRIHMTCLRGDLLSIGLDFADPFPDALRKITNGEPATVLEYEPSPRPARDPSRLL
ncbi:telomere-protecting terminal protein Tpg [Streptomyces scopuliridis]|uniref:telomere-protecting terminal protein Tpg n=1 Tax=Streptomyces scopuliridis TaxID=452529 RepID=UPI00368FADF6